MGGRRRPQAGKVRISGRFTAPPAPTTFLLFGPFNGMACFVYVLQSEKDGTHYVGITSRLGRRIREHNRGDSRSTRAGGPWKLLHKERCEDHAVARRREEFLKSGAGHEWLAGQLTQRPAPATGR